MSTNLPKYLVAFWLIIPGFTFASDLDRQCLRRAVYEESRGESLKGMQAVAEVILNRVSNPNFPPTIHKVISQKGQFSWYSPRKGCKPLQAPKTPEDKATYVLLDKAITGASAGSKRILPKDTLYFCHKRLKPKWTRGKIRVTVIGRHAFYR